MNGWFRENAVPVLIVLSGILVLAILVWQFRFIQDDAYISYRYAANYLNGDGLVFNIGERVEGFTNFGWVMLLLFAGSIGLDFILFSQIVGFLCAAGLIALAWFLGREMIPDAPPWLSAASAIVVGATLSLAYWATAGLEVSAFGLCVAVSLYWYLKHSRLLVFGLLAAVWIRPEGGLVVLLLLIAEAVTRRRWPRFVFGSALIAFILSLPMVAFKIGYYGSILPNPFYAKTGWDFEQLRSGLEYAARFFTHYPLYALALVMPLVLLRRVPRPFIAVWLFAVLYTVYIVLIGGDVLKVHRFFIPLIPAFAALLVGSAWFLSSRLSTGARCSLTVVIAVVAMMAGYSGPRGFVATYYKSEIALTRKMSFLADRISETDSRDFSVALSTIGIFSYRILGHRVVDMLGLTDSTIARHPSDPPPGMRSTWKERHYNTGYLLRENPDYIVFSTGFKPSAPAEQDLLRYRQFRDRYHAVGWFYPSDSTELRGSNLAAFKLTGAAIANPVADYPIEPILAYKEGYEAFTRGQIKRALVLYDQAIDLAPEPTYVYLLYQKALCHRMLGQHDTARRILNDILRQDSLVVEAQWDLYMYTSVLGDTAKAAIHRRFLQETVPWYLPIIQREIDELMAAERQRGRTNR